MKRHSLICRFGATDRSRVSVIERDSRQTVVQFVQGNKRLEHGIGSTLDAIRDQGIHPSEAGLDLLVLASLVYCADTRINRESEAQDGWTREIDVYLPVHDHVRWNDLSTKISALLEFLTGDKWRFYFRARPKQFSTLCERPTQQTLELPTSVCLFSGGLDSFIGAIDLLEQGQKPLFVSHAWVANASDHQKLCVDALDRQYGAPIQRIRAHVGFHKNLITRVGAESTERSRSFLFFSLAALAASGLKKTDATIYVPENGLISLNVPLDPLRLGSLSTRTTHPHYMSGFDSLLQGLGIPAHVKNPYFAMTKGKMVAGCRNQVFLGKNIIRTMSCSSPNKARWKKLPPGHCGYCLPCIIRRASLLDWKPKDPTVYHEKNLKARTFDSSKAEGDNLRSFQLAIKRLGNDIQKAQLFIHKSGPLPQKSTELDAYARVYLDGMQEVGRLLKGVKTSPHAIASS
jgi:7-cyano-7-deazaguanine synthase in queuosine biosynthesis